MNKKILLILCGISFFAFTFKPGDDPKKLGKKADDDNSKYTNVGNVGLTITNFGTYGHGFALWPQQPCAEFPLNSGIEHIYDGALWVGGYIANDSLGSGKSGPYVTTGAVDAASASRGGGWEYTNAPGSKVVEKSNLLTSKYYQPDAVSHQDLVCDYTDTSTTLANGEVIQFHSPLGIAVHQESYAWNFPFANFFVIMNYTIKNVSNKYIDSVYVGLWTDAVVRNTNVTSPRSGTPFFNKGGDGYSDSMRIAYEFDAAGDNCDSYVGIQFLGSTPALPNNFITELDTIPSVNFVSWQHSNTSDPLFFSPLTDIDRYPKMQGYFAADKRFGKGVNPQDLKTPSNRSIFITSGPYKSLKPGDSVNVVFSITFGKKYGSDPASYDTELQKKNLYSDAEWALRAYYGEDRNRNNILDPGEDLDGNGKITRFILPAPPNIPKIKVIPENQKVTIYWDKNPENSIDPISAKKDFEGYRIYRTNAGYDLNQQKTLLESLILVAEFDSAGNDIGFNTGFKYIKLDEPVKFKGDTTNYYYKFELKDLLNGWQYAFSVTAFDKGDPINNLESLESSNLSNLITIIPGTLPSEVTGNKEIGVYPNPYYGNAYWDGGVERLRKIYFYNLPSECEITIYTLSGDVVKRITHDQSSNGSDLRWFQTYAQSGNQVMAGGEHAWDLITNNDQAIATGLYLFTVKDKKTGDIKTGKFLIVK